MYTICRSISSCIIYPTRITLEKCHNGCVQSAKPILQTSKIQKERIADLSFDLISTARVWLVRDPPHYFCFNGKMSIRFAEHRRDTNTTIS